VYAGSVAEDKAVTALVSAGAEEVAEVAGSGTIVAVVFVEATTGVAAEELTIGASRAVVVEATTGLAAEELIFEVLAEV
jgi:hypothetical protein